MIVMVKTLVTNKKKNKKIGGIFSQSLVITKSSVLCYEVSDHFHLTISLMKFLTF